MRTVEGELRTALDEVVASWERLAVAGRTDAGVHALGQVASVEADGGPPVGRIADPLNAALPDDVSVVEAEEAPPGFHARHSARARSYRYRILRRRARSPLEARRALWYPRPLDRTALDEAAVLLVGVHDFRAFTPADSDQEVCRRSVLEARWVDRKDADALEFEITADSFLRRMVRTLVGTMLEVPPERLAELLSGDGSRADAGSTAPPWGLYLVSVRY